MAYDPVTSGDKISVAWANHIEDALDEIATKVVKNTVTSIKDAVKGNLVYYGLHVSQRSAGANMSVDVSAGDAIINGSYVNKASKTNVAVTPADSSYPRKDIVVIDSSGTISVIAGTAEKAIPHDETGVNTRKPEPPDIPSNKIILAEIWVAAGATSITDADITDRRVLGPQHFPWNLMDIVSQSYLYSCYRYWDGYIQIFASKSFRGSTTVGLGIQRAAVYLQTFRRIFGYGTYEAKAYVSGRETGKYFYPFMMEYPFHSSTASWWFRAKDTSDNKVQTGWNGSNTQTDITGWDPTTEATLKVEWSSSQVKFYVNGTLKATHTTYIPQKPMPLTLELRQDEKDSDYTNDSCIYFKDFGRVA